MNWSVPPQWSGQRAYIIGGGPSVSRLRLNLLRSENVIVTNNAYQLLPWAAFCFWMDMEWFKRHAENLRSTFQGQIVSIHAKAKDFSDILSLERGNRSGLSLNPRKIHHGSNSGHGAINLAVLLNASPIYLLGFDMQTRRGHHNYHSDHVREMADNVYKKYLEMMGTIPAETPEGIEIYNATPDSALTAFPLAETEIERLYEPA